MSVRVGNAAEKMRRKYDSENVYIVEN